MANYTKFKIYLAEKNITQQELAELLGVTRTTINRILSGNQGADFKVQDIVKICETYKIEAADYFF